MIVIDSPTQYQIKEHCKSRVKHIVTSYKQSPERDDILRAYGKVVCRVVQNKRAATRAIVNQLDDRYLDKLVASWFLEH